MGTIFLCNIEDANKLIEEERLYWTYSVLDALKIPEEIYLSNNIDEYLNNMDQYGIDIILHTNGNVDIYKKEWYQGKNEQLSGWLPPTKEHLIAQWKTPSKIRIVEGKNVYYEVHTNEWSSLKIRK